MTTKSKRGANARIDRRPFVAELLGQREGALVVPGLGSPTWDSTPSSRQSSSVPRRPETGDGAWNETPFSRQTMRGAYAS